MNKATEELTEKDLNHLRRCLALAREALDAGDEPFGSILVNDKEKVVAEARNRVNELNCLAHPEIELAHWAADNLSPQERRQTRMYTGGSGQEYRLRCVPNRRKKALIAHFERHGPHFCAQIESVSFDMWSAYHHVSRRFFL